jgi:hypothetical protein
MASTTPPEVGLRRRYRVAVAVATVLLLALVVRSADPFDWFVSGPDGEPAAAGEPTLIAIRETAELKAASGTFSVPVELDVEQTGLRQRLPDFVDQEKIIAIYQADVDATIDLRGLTADAIDADPETRTITVRVPTPKLSRPAIDPENSRIVSHDRGALQRIEDALGEGSLAAKEQLDAAAVEAIAKAARESELPDTARVNGARFLTLLCERMGYEHITIEYAGAPS